jgi:hypothetical protein
MLSKFCLANLKLSEILHVPGKFLSEIFIKPGVCQLDTFFLDNLLGLLFVFCVVKHAFTVS